MVKKSSISFICMFLIFVAFAVILLPCDASEDDDGRKTYIIYMGSLPKVSSYSPTSHHLSILEQVIHSGDNETDATSSLVRSYKRSFNGFAAKLTSDQRDKIAQVEGVVSVFESKTLQTQTTRSWDFMGFVEDVAATKRNSSAESEVIVGFIDTGIWPESESFSDENFGAVPKKWRGRCGGGKNFTCNKKIIGARYYGENDSARDKNGHGTHTASIAAGNIVDDASFYGIGQGSARGGVPSARIASYAACSVEGLCKDVHILAAFDDAISDGVTILSLSLGNMGPVDLARDPVSIGAFHAMERGILTVQAAGNEGPYPAGVTSLAPWILTVAASTTDRSIIDKLVLGNGHTIIGNSVNSFLSNGSKFPIATKNGDSNECHAPYATSCLCFDAHLVKGKIVVCPQLPDDDGVLPRSKGIVGIIAKTAGKYDVWFDVVTLPSLAISSKDYDTLNFYVNSTKHPKAEILQSEAIIDVTAPKVVNFSSRGPNKIVPEILKPDISAPGFRILAAYSPLASEAEYFKEKGYMRYNILSGTSMSCPHASGVAAYLKSLHPDWSPAAIKSAILTTAKPMNKSYSFDLVGEFEYGFGHLNPVQAGDPGLVYDISKQDYLEMLCNLGFNASKIEKLSRENYTCPATSHRDLVKNLNYPSFTAKVEASKPFKVIFNRTVTNVGFANSTYKSSVLPNSKVNITVEPEILSFKSLNEKKPFVVTVVGGEISNQTVISSSLVWSDGNHNVRSPIIVMACEINSFF